MADVDVFSSATDLLTALRTGGTTAADLTDRYIRRIDFEADAEAALGLEKVDLEFEAPAADEEPTPGADARTGRVPLAGILGHTLGTLAVTVRPLEEVLSAEREARSRVRRGLLALLAVAFAFAAPVGRLGSRPLRGIVRAGLLLGARAALLALGMPRDLVRADPFDPTAFSLDRWGGALGTPGDEEEDLSSPGFGRESWSEADGAFDDSGASFGRERCRAGLTGLADLQLAIAIHVLVARQQSNDGGCEHEPHRDAFHRCSCQ